MDLFYFIENEEKIYYISKNGKNYRTDENGYIMVTLKNKLQTLNLKDDDYIYLQSPMANNCKCKNNKHELPSCMFKITSKEWKYLGEKLNEYKSITSLIDFESQGCMVTLNFNNMYNETKLISNDIFKSIYFIENDKFISCLRDEINILNYYKNRGCDYVYQNITNKSKKKPTNMALERCGNPIEFIFPGKFCKEHNIS